MLQLNRQEPELFDGESRKRPRGLVQPRAYFGGGIIAGIGGLAAIGGTVASLANSGGGANGTQSQQQSPGQTASQTLAAIQQAAPGMYATTNQYAPLYQSLQGSLLTNAGSGILSNYQQYAPQLQTDQNLLNLSQGSGQINLEAGLGNMAVQAYQSANPQLQALQQQYTALAQGSPNPVGQITGGGWGQNFANNASNAINGAQVQAPMAQTTAGVLGGFSPNVLSVNAAQNQTLNQLNSTAQQQLALGTSVSPQQQATVANQVLSNYNAMGRAEDPTAIAGLATGLDTYGQQLLQQRESAAQTAAGLTTNQSQLGLSAQQSNQAAALQGSGQNLTALSTMAGLGQQTNLANQASSLAAQQANLSSQLGLQGLTYQGLYGSGQQSLAASQANQQAQLQNAQYQQSLLNGASQLAYTSAQYPLQLLLGQQSGALSGANALTTQAGNTVTAGNQLSSMYNPFANGAFNSVYGSEQANNQFNASTNQSLLGSSLSLLGSSGVMNSLSNLGGSLSGLFGGGSDWQGWQG